VDARIEMKEKFRNAVGFRKVRALLEMTLAREFKATTSCYSFRIVKEETKVECSHC